MYIIVDLTTCFVVTNDKKSLHIQTIMLIVLQAPYCAQNSASILWKGLVRAENLLFLAGGCWGRWSFVLELEQGWGCGSRAIEEGWG